MSGLTFYIVDVFAEEKFAGNQLAVFRGGGALADVEMQRIAREMNFSETTFILSETQRDGGFDVRIFTPREEVPFAGHPTLGTAHIIRHEIKHIAAGKIVLNLKAGQIPVTFVDEEGNANIYWMKQIEPVFGRQFSPEIISAVLSLRQSEIDDRFPIEEVSTGLPFIIVPLRSLESLKRARVDKEKYFDLIENNWAKSIAIFCPEPHKPKNNISVRMFGDYYGVPEDPATGSGNGCLAAYLVHRRFWGQNKIDIRAEQGYEIGRPSLLLLKADEKEGKINVRVGGKAITIAKGEFV
ncbi:MAG: PhzF family phenazine biosynthesis protein [Thermoguttaceae bacterium]|jgi:trans-2,3-dihydro-3-hydroxyanthranilate isomerase